jgi:Tol biopolymer transport system component
MQGHRPRWSPDGQWIAVVAGYQILLVRPDGSDLRVLSSPDIRYMDGIDWSPDGRWIVASRFYRGNIDLIEVGTGLTLPLAFTSGLTEPVWRPR